MSTISTTVHVSGMTCGHCVSAVSEELESLAGVEDIAVDLNAGGVSTVTITSTQELFAVRNRRGSGRSGLPCGGQRGVSRPAERARTGTMSTEQLPGQPRQPGDRTRHRGHDLRIVREPGGKEARQARRRPGHGQPPPGIGPRDGPGGITDQQITDQVAAAGYKATISRPQHAGQAVGCGLNDATPPAAGFPRSAGTGERPPGRTAARQPTLKPRLIVAAVLTVPVFLISMFPAFQFANWGWVAGALALPVVSWAAWPFHRAAAIHARHFTSTMDTLVSLGVLAAYVFSAWQLFADPRLTEHPGMEQMGGGAPAACTSRSPAWSPLSCCSAGSWRRTPRPKAGDALKALLNLGAKDATVLVNGAEVKIPADQLAVDDVVVVRPGEKIATDGVVISGSSAVDASLVTGESVPVEVGPGSPVTGATINTVRPAAGPRHPRRRRNNAGPDGPARGPGADRKGADRQAR